MNKIAILLTVYGGDKFENFVAALKSLYNQTYKEFDIFIQEDGPVNIEISNFLNEELKKSNICYYGKRKINFGFDYSLNELISIALEKGYEYIVRMDSDDICCPERINSQYKFMKINQEIDVCGMEIEEFGDNLIYKKIVSYPTSHEGMLLLFRKRAPIAHVTAFFRNTFFKKAGLYEVEGHLNNGDMLMWLKGFDKGCRFANLNEVGVKVRVTKDFFNRRSGLKKAMSDFKNRLLVNKVLRFGFLAYLYAFLVFLLNISPAFVKVIAYKNLR